MARFSRFLIPLLLAGVLFADEVLDIATVIALHQAGLSPEVIVNKIQTADRVQFHNSTDELLQLGKAGVPSAVVEAMQRRASVAPTPAEAGPVITDVARAYAALPDKIGVFLLVGEEMVRIEPEPVKNEFVGFGLAKGVLGLRKPKVPHYVEGGPSPAVARQQKPILLLYMPGEKLSVFRLIRALKGNPQRRELFQAVPGLFSATEVVSKEVALRSNPIAEGYYELIPAENLSPGEYAVVDYGVNGGTPRAWPFRVVVDGPGS